MERHEVSIDPRRFRRRWVAHIDLLGASVLVDSESWTRVFQIYARAIEKSRRGGFAKNRVRRFTFSDSFIFYTTDDTAYSYRALDSLCRSFVLSLIQSQIPVRGAMAFGNLYADPRSSIYFGEALLDAYRTGESLDWVGFVLSDSSDKRLSEVGLPVAERLNYAYWEVPIKSVERGNTGMKKRMPAFIISLSPSLSNIGKISRSLVAMQSRAHSDFVRQKYSSTLDFLSSNIRTNPAAN